MRLGCGPIGLNPQWICGPTSEYDLQNRLIAENNHLDGRAITTEYTYDPSGNRTHVLDPLGSAPRAIAGSWPTTSPIA
ncbi:MAG: RHS repeat protein [Planctomycetes bacterium]|nr:RHS repeat protein [Planctomycetota bacterium]